MKTMKRHGSRLGLKALALAAGLLASGLVASRADAGIIILKNGKVFVGKIDAEDVKGTGDEQTVTMHEPKLFKGAPPVHGEQTFAVHDIRWWDQNADEPTDDYLKDHLDDPIDPRYQKYIEQYKDRKQQEVSIDPHMLFSSSGGSNKLAPMPFSYRWDQDEISIRKPLNWSLKKTPSGIFIFESDAKPTEANQGFTPKIHLFAVERAAAGPTDQIDWIKDEIRKLAQTDSGYDEKEHPVAKVVRGGTDAEMTTVTRRNGKSIVALRNVKFREHRTYFLSCYAHEADYENLVFLFRACVQSLQITEAGVNTNTSSAADKIDTTGVKVGQVFKWRSATSPDLRTAEVIAVDAATVTRKVTRTNADGSKATKDEPETVGSLDPIGRLTSIAGASVSPNKARSETLTVSGQPFDCDVYEATSNGKRYSVWLSRKYPVQLKVVVDGTVQEELSEIK